MAGVVGAAELLAASLALAALALYLSAARAGRGIVRWTALAGVMGLGWLAALSKETGVTVVSRWGISRIAPNPGWCTLMDK